MMRETVTNLNPDWGELVDVDVLPSGQWAGLFNAGGQAWPGGPRFIRTPDDCVPFDPLVSIPMVRCLDSRALVIVDSRAHAWRSNGWILSLADKTRIEFSAGDGIQDVLASQDAIVVTYFDEGVYSGIPPGDEGVAIFYTSGRLRAGYRSSLAANAVHVDDCYAACWQDKTHIAFSPYTGFPLVSWDVETLEQEVQPLPQELHGSSAITVSDDRFLFFSPYDIRNGIVAWSPKKEPTLVGQHPGPLRGLRGGRFLSRGTHGFTIVECDIG
jgi:hypothetical protein